MLGEIVSGTIKLTPRFGHYQCLLA